MGTDTHYFFQKKNSVGDWEDLDLDQDYIIESSFKACAASQQAEIDELQKRIDELDVKLKSLEHTSKECMNAMSLSCGKYLMENKTLSKVIFDIKEYMVNAPLKHVSQTATLRVLDILNGLKGESNE